MALNQLTIAEMVETTEDWARAGTPVRQAFEQIPALAGLIPTVDQVIDNLLATQRVPFVQTINQLSHARAKADRRHDCLARAVHVGIEAHIQLALAEGDLDRAQSLRRARDFLFPLGLGIVRLSYREEAGQASLLASRMNGDVEALLATMVLGSGTLLDTVRAWLRAADELGQLEAEFVAVQLPQNRVSLRDSRRAWTQMVTAVRTVAALADPMDPRIEAALGHIANAELAAERRLAGEAGESDDGSAPDESGDEPDIEPDQPDELAV